MINIPFTDSRGNAHSFRLAPGPITEDGDTTPIPSALDGLDAYDRFMLGQQVHDLVMGSAASASDAGDDE